MLKQDNAGSGSSERGLPLGTRGAAVYARDKVVLLGCLLCSNADDEVQQGRRSAAAQTMVKGSDAEEGQ